MKQKITIGVVFLFAMLFMFTPLMGQAAIYVGQDDYTLGTDEVAEGNVYAGGTSITINGTVTGDLIATGNIISLNGTLQDDVVVVGVNVTVSGTLEDDLRGGGGTLVISGTVVGDVNVAGVTVTITDGAVITGDVVVASGTLIHNGVIEGSLGASSSEIKIAGTIGKNVEVKVETLEVTGDAIIGGTLQYEGPSKAIISSDATIDGNTIFTEKKSDQFGKYFGTIGLTLAGFFVNLIGALIVTLILVILLPAFSQKVVDRANENFWKSFLIGLLLLIVMPVLGMLLLVTVLGIPLAVIVFVLYMMLLMFGGMYAGVVVGAYLIKLFQKERVMGSNWKSALLGVIVLQAVMLVPIIGWIIGFIFFLVGLGAFSTAFYKLITRP